MRRSPWSTLVVLAVAQFMVVLDVTIVNVALPHIQTDLKFSTNDLQWVISAYTLIFGGFLLLGGRAADLLGRRRVFVVGLILFGISSLAAGLANSAFELILFRGVQGLGGALLSASALTILTVTFEHGRRRNIALGIWGGLAGLGGTMGAVDADPSFGRKVRGLKVTSAELTDYVERVLRNFDADRSAEESFAAWVQRAPEEALS